MGHSSGRAGGGAKSAVLLRIDGPGAGAEPAAAPAIPVSLESEARDYVPGGPRGGQARASPRPQCGRARAARPSRPGWPRKSCRPSRGRGTRWGRRPDHAPRPRRAVAAAVLAILDAGRAALVRAPVEDRPGPAAPRSAGSCSPTSMTAEIRARSPRGADWRATAAGLGGRCGQASRPRPVSPDPVVTPGRPATRSAPGETRCPGRHDVRPLGDLDPAILGPEGAESGRR